MNCIIHIDGGSRGNPGPAGVGVVIHDADTRQPIHEAGYFVGRTTNNVAEYTGLLRSLELADQLGAKAVEIRSDSQLMVRQLHGQYRVKSADLRPLFEQARRQLDALGAWALLHVPREKNQRADELANLAMDARRDVIVTTNGKTRKPVADRTSKPAASAKKPTIDPEAMWQITVEGESDACPAHMPADHTAALGPTVGDALLCIHAAAAIFQTGLPNWAATKRKAIADCAACNRRIQIRRT